MHPVFCGLMDWLLIGKALCLVAVLEGLAYALAPGGMRDAAAIVARMPIGSLRGAGLLTMAVGATLLFVLSH